MAYSNFSLQDVTQKLGVTIRTTPNLFGQVPAVPVRASVLELLREMHSLATLMNTEKARSELLVAPLLAEVWRQGKMQVSFLSGVDLVVDPERGLTGFCDFLLGRGPQLNYVTAPLLAVVEAKNDNVVNGLGPAAAETVAVRDFNLNEKRPAEAIFGASTTGTNWRFMRLTGTELTIDAKEYMLGDVDKIYGILLHTVGLNAIQTVDYTACGLN